LLESLTLLGINSRISEKTRGSLKSPNCFAAPAQYEIESISEGKLIGSAQVIKDGVVLQHGAIPITGSYSNIGKYLNCENHSFKTALSLNQVSDQPVREEELLSSLKRGFAKHLPLEEGTLTAFELASAERLRESKYSQQKWMFRK
ncbi:MAG: hypothetical protein AMS17_12410, partial [Spirochaetes bacterium DG_61]